MKKIFLLLCCLIGIFIFILFGITYSKRELYEGFSERKVISPKGNVFSQDFFYEKEYNYSSVRFKLGEKYFLHYNGYETIEKDWKDEKTINIKLIKIKNGGYIKLINRIDDIDINLEIK
jgi:hypothetical protein